MVCFVPARSNVLRRCRPPMAIILPFVILCKVWSWGATKSSVPEHARGAPETPKTRHYYSGKGARRDAKREAACVQRADDRGGAEEAQRPEKEARGRLGRPGHRRRQRLPRRRDTEGPQEGEGA